MHRSGEDLFASGVSKFYLRDFTKLQEIGKGGEATAYKGYNPRTGEVCLKVFQFHQNNRIGPSYDEVRLLLKHAHHQNVVDLYGLIEQENSTFPVLIGYVMQYCPGGSLHSVIHGNMQYNERHVCNWVLQAARGLAHLHDRGVIHRDVKPSNMLLLENYNNLKLADFGIAQRVEPSGMCTTGGTWIYMAPELHANQQIGTSVDVYALGISFWEMLYRKQPFSTMRETREIIDKVTWENKRPPIDETFSSTLTDLVKSCWKNHPTDRIRIMELINRLTNYKDQNKTRKPTIAPAEGGRMMENSSARAHTHYQSLPNNPSNPRNQGANDEFDLVDHIRELSMGSQNWGNPSERKERKHRKKHRKEKRVTESDEEEEAVFFPSSSASQPNSVPTSSASAAADVAPEPLLSTIYSHLLRLEPDVFQLTVANFQNFMITCMQDLANFRNGQANLSANCVRAYGLGPDGYIPNPGEILEQHIETQILQKKVHKYVPCLFICTFTFGPNNYNDADIAILNQVLCAFQASCSIYDADCRRIPRFLINNKFKILIVGTSPNMSAVQLYKSIVCLVQKDLPNPEELFSLDIDVRDININCKLADTACPISATIAQLGAVHQVIYLVDVNNWHGTGTFGPEWKTLANEKHALFYVGCTGEDQHRRNTIKVAQQFTFTKYTVCNVLPFLDGTSFAHLWADRQRIYKTFDLVYRRAVMNLVNKVPPLSCYS